MVTMWFLGGMFSAANFVPLFEIYFCGLGSEWEQWRGAPRLLPSLLAGGIGYQVLFGSLRGSFGGGF